MAFNVNYPFFFFQKLLKLMYDVRCRVALYESDGLTSEGS